MCAQMLLVELQCQRQVGRLGHDALLVQHGYDAHWLQTRNSPNNTPALHLLDEFYARGQIETEVNECPLDALTLILLLFEHEHVMVEELLQLFVHKIDPQLFK
jgi:hypothetical protein